MVPPLGAGLSGSACDWDRVTLKTGTRRLPGLGWEAFAVWVLLRAVGPGPQDGGLREVVNIGATGRLQAGGSLQFNKFKRSQCQPRLLYARQPARRSAEPSLRLNGTGRGVCATTLGLAGVELGAACTEPSPSPSPALRPDGGAQKGNDLPKVTHPATPSQSRI